MKEPTRTKMSVVLTNLRERKWGEDGVKRLWDCQNLCLLRAQCIAAAIHSCHPQSAWIKNQNGGMLDLHLAPNLPAGLCHTKPNILRCQPVSSSAPTQRHKCLFKYQEAQRCSCTPAHLWNIFPHFWCSGFLDCCCLNVDWPLSVHFEKQKYKPKLSSIFCCQSESALQKDSKFQDFHLWGKVKLLKL